jgi:hypothetical protein
MLNPRSGYNANMFCQHDSSQTSTYYNWRGEETALVADGGSVAVVTGCDGETTIIKRMTSCDEEPFGLLMQEVRKPYDHAYIPWGMIQPNDVGTQMTFIGGPVAVAHMGIHDTNVYDASAAINAGDRLYPTASGTLTSVSGTGFCGKHIAVAMNTLSTAELATGRLLRIKLLI